MPVHAQDQIQVLCRDKPMLERLYLALGKQRLAEEKKKNIIIKNTIKFISDIYYFSFLSFFYLHCNKYQDYYCHKKVLFHKLLVLLLYDSF